MEINWKQDYQGEFICYKCEETPLILGGFKRGRRQFRCSKCKCAIPSSLSLNRRSLYLKSRLVDERVNWEKDYHGEFICPECNQLGMSARGIKQPNNKRQFRCPHCKKTQQDSYNIKGGYEVIKDPINESVVWYRNHRIEGFVCPECNAMDMYMAGVSNKYNKKLFRCRSCHKHQYDYIELNQGNLSYFTEQDRYIKPFEWQDDQWDLRNLNPNYNPKDPTHFIANFTEIKQLWLKDKAKKYVEHLCSAEKAFGTIGHALVAFRSLSRHLRTTSVTNFKQIDRSIIFDYLSQEKKVTKNKLTRLRDFFFVGTVKGWFEIDQDIIRDEDYPKGSRGNPDPLSEKVREQIEASLYILPESIARMYLICYFGAMRPSELSLLKQDCLIQEGQYWKLGWHRQKTKDYHEIPISRTIAKVVQEQLDYIQNLWGDEYDYLFCHYHGLSSTEASQPNVVPIKKVIQNVGSHPLMKSIRTLISALDIRDENGELATFTNKILRPTRLTNLFEEGHDLAVVSAWAGHKHFATTSTYYTKVSCELIDKEAGHIQKALVNAEGKQVPYESFPKSFWENPTAHKLELSGTHINTPIYGYCGLDLDQDCHKFRACYTCNHFIATPDKLDQYIKVRDELRGKQSKALASGQDVLVEQFGRQADTLDKIIQSLQQEVA